MAKSGRQFWTLALLLTTAFSLSEAVRCLSCDHVNNPQDCNHIVTCPSYQECVTEQRVSASGIQYFRLGCEDKVNCGVSGSTAIGKKRGLLANITQRDLNDELIACRHCCNGADGCNANLCTTRRSRDLRCLRCTDAIEANHCEEVEVCGPYESCYVHHGVNFVIGETRISMGCMGEKQCEAIKHAYSQRCTTCCNNADYCNYDACDNYTITTPGTPVPRIKATTTQQVQTTTKATPTTPKPGPPSVSCTRSPITTYFRVYCHVTGYPIPTIVRWFYHKPPSPYYISRQSLTGVYSYHNETDYTLTVSPYDPLKHNGEWVLDARNTYGYAKDKVTVP